MNSFSEGALSMGEWPLLAKAAIRRKADIS
jgi:hypothetical protein